ncbi:MAG: esterase-like activity of phytase family protein [Gemmatimonadaceae bacterium]|jgi:hypothetical protein|nr:esterase-like activity of phytase family protein [Gemmatimonadaceae bacterium]
MRSTPRLVVVVLMVLATACTDDVSSPAPIVYPERAADGAPTTWGTLGGVGITGGYGSALATDPRDPSIFYVMTDRGPNVTTGVSNQLLFPLPTFGPVIGRFQLVGDSLRRLSTIEMRTATGARISGLPNPVGAGATGETAVGVGGTPLGTDPDGLDAEGLVVATDGTFWVSDEYGPHIVHLDATGRTIERINPFGNGAGGRRLPRVLALRRPNRGMEGLTITPDGRTLVGMMQSPLDNPSAAIGRQSNALRIVTFDIASGATRQYVYETDAVGLLSSEILALSSTSFLVLERDGNFQGGSPTSTSKRVYRIDVTGATDVSDPSDAPGGRLFGGRVLEALTAAERRAAGIVATPKSLVVDLLTLPGGYPHDKAEGLAVIGNSRLVVSNDDDFGVVEGGVNSFINKMLPNGQRDRLFLRFITTATPFR